MTSGHKHTGAVPRRIFFAAAFALCLAAAAFAAWNILAAGAAYSVSRAEYAAFRAEYAPKAASADTLSRETEAPSGDAAPGPPPDPAEVNPEYAGWIRIAGTAVDYPVARGPDNKKYLSMNFMGEKEKAGAIFMDYRCVEDFDGFHTVIYGHNMKDGSMFSDLNRYTDPDWASAHGEIEITAPDGETAVYRVFSARLTDVYDGAYGLDFGDAGAAAGFFAALGAPGGARVLTLSTCRPGGDRNARMLVHAALDKNRVLQL
jgi:SrtB family sortase